MTHRTILSHKKDASDFIGSKSKKKIVHPIANSTKYTLQDAFADLPEIDITTGLSEDKKFKPMSKIYGEKRKKLMRFSEHRKYSGMILRME